MNKPYVICHMLTSLDGKIDGYFMSAPETSPIAAEVELTPSEVAAIDRALDGMEISQVFGGSPMANK